MMSIIFIIVCGCAKSQLTIAEFIRPPSKILRFRDIHTIHIQQPLITLTNVNLTKEALKMYEQTILDIFAHLLSHKPWYQIDLPHFSHDQSDGLSEQIQSNGFTWTNPVPLDCNNDRYHRLFSTVNMIEKEENDSEIYIKANMSIVMLDAQGKEIYVQLFKNLFAKGAMKGSTTFMEQLCLHKRLACQLFESAIEKIVEEICPKTIRQVMSIHDDSDIKGRFLLAGEAFPEALAHIKQSIKEKERMYIHQKNKISHTYKQMEDNLNTLKLSDEKIREKRIELAKEKESKIDQARKFLSGDYNNYGTALEGLGFFNEAISYYEKAFIADPFNYMARLAFHRLIYFRKTSNKELELNLETIESQ
jgi:tetratricopeptide (TPR) repeat protein